jgi:hypothetical protein
VNCTCHRLIEAVRPLQCLTAHDADTTFITVCVTQGSREKPCLTLQTLTSTNKFNITLCKMNHSLIDIFNFYIRHAVIELLVIKVGCEPAPATSFSSEPEVTRAGSILLHLLTI